LIFLSGLKNWSRMIATRIIMAIPETMAETRKMKGIKAVFHKMRALARARMKPV